MDTSVILDRARLLLEQGRTKDAIRELKHLLSADPSNPEALSLYARCYYDDEKFDEGIDMMNRAIQLSPSDPFYFYLLGYGHYRKGAHATALANLDTSIRMNPYYAEFFGLQAVIFIEERKFEKALSKADEGLALDPENITCLNARAIALNKLKRTDAAIETMKDALAQHPDNAFTHSTVGWNLLEKGKHKESTRHFREALRLSPNMSAAKTGLKESLKSQIPPYRWLLQYSFWIHNKGKKAALIVPIALYIAVNLITRVLRADSNTEVLATIVVGIYIVFIVITWIISPLANLFLFFHKDGRHALTVTEKWTALTVATSLLFGLAALGLHFAIGEPANLEYPPMLMTAFILWLLAVPLADIGYPISLKHPGSRNKTGLTLTALGITSIILAFTWYPAALVVGGIFLIGFVLNNWFGLFR